MILDLKKIVYISILFYGFYFFYSEFNKLYNYEYKFKKNNISNIEIQTNKEKSELKKIEKVEKNKNTKKRIIEPKLDKTVIEVSRGDTFLSILNRFDLSDAKNFEIISKIEEFFKLNKLKVDDKIIFYQDSNKKIKEIEIGLDIDTALIVNISDTITVEKKKFEKLSYQISKEFNILESLYNDGLKNDLPQDILIKLIKLFSFDLDFQRDIKKDTLVSVSYEFNQIQENNQIEFKDINYALISIDGKKLEYFKFLTNDGFIDYFNREGKNVKKSILKTPLDGARLSSSFGMRKHPISGYNKMHKGVDFAAPKGTPIYAGGNGVIEYIGNNGGYGKYIRIRHNNDYKTAYAHLSGYKKGISKGVRVNQGDVIGFVGSTGVSTGPHLHYEILFQNKQINPLKLKLPSGKILVGEELIRFKKEYKRIYANHLNLLYE